MKKADQDTKEEMETAEAARGGLSKRDRDFRWREISEGSYEQGERSVSQAHCGDVDDVERGRGEGPIADKDQVGVQGSSGSRGETFAVPLNGLRDTDA